MDRFPPPLRIFPSVEGIRPGRRMRVPSVVVGSLLLASCLAAPESIVAESVPLYVSFHADPLVRKGESDCATAGLDSCGQPDGRVFAQRTDNLVWLVEEALPPGATPHLEMGPDGAWAWSGEAELVETLAETAGTSVDNVQEVAARGRAALVDWVEGGGSLGLHTHGQLPDDEGRWGAVDLDEDSSDACEAWAGDPLAEVSAALSEEVVYTTAQAGDDLLVLLREEAGEDSPIQDLRYVSYTGSVPRRLARKRTAIEDPDALDTATDRSMPGSFAPVTPGPAFSECFFRAADHAPFSGYPLHDELALGAGTGPPVLPGEPALGRMDRRFGDYRDSSPPAARRRLLQLLVNWRWNALTGGDAIPWLFTWGNHLYDLCEGETGSFDPLGREAMPEVGSTFRQDWLSFSEWIEDLRLQTSWFGVEAPDGVVAWMGMEDAAARQEAAPEDASFSYVAEDGETPLLSWDAERYPYLPRVAEALMEAHLVCEGEWEGTTVYGFQRCDAGWTWGEDTTGGYGCRDAVEPTWTYLFLADRDTCVGLPEGDGTVMEGVAVDGEHWEPLGGCPGGFDVVRQGLLVEARGGGQLFAGAGCPG